MGSQGLYAVRTANGGAPPAANVLEERVKLLTSSQLGKGLSHDDIMKIASCARPKTFTRDETLFIQGEPARCLLLIRTGSVKITQISSNGNEVILWMYGRGAAAKSDGPLRRPLSSTATTR